MLNLSILEKARRVGNKTIARCPVCASAGRDRSAEHLSILENNTYHCIVGCDSKEIFSMVGVKTNLTQAEKAEWAKGKAERDRKAKIAAANVAKSRKIAATVSSRIDRVLSGYVTQDWRDYLLSDSPLPLTGSNLRGMMVEQLFNERGVIWMGNTRTETGQPHHAANFKTAKEWMSQHHRGHPLPSLVSGGTFKIGTISRGKAYVETSPYIVVECDDIIGREPITDPDKELNKLMSFALACWLVDKLKLRLKAIVDTGNKSLHLWFCTPSPATLERIKAILKGVKYDGNVLNGTSYSPLRLHGAIHQKTQTPAKLLWLNF
jgi:hypothetical protein